MSDSLQVRSTVTLYCDYARPEYHCAHTDNRHAVRLAPIESATDIYLTGTLDELAAFVLELAGVVRELNARELAAAAEKVDVTPRRMRSRYPGERPRYEGGAAPMPVRDIIKAIDGLR